jgi:hypothetical protein
MGKLMSQKEVKRAQVLDMLKAAATERMYILEQSPDRVKKTCRTLGKNDAA